METIGYILWAMVFFVAGYMYHEYELIFLSIIIFELAKVFSFSQFLLSNISNIYLAISLILVMVLEAIFVCIIFFIHEESNNE